MPIITLPTPGTPSFLEIDEDGATQAEYAAARERRLPVGISGVSSGVQDLRAVEPLFDVVRQLTVHASEITDYRAVTKMPQLESFWVGEESSGPRDLRECRALRSYGGSFDESVIFSDVITYDLLVLHGTGFRSLASWRGSSREIRLMASRRRDLDLTHTLEAFRATEVLLIDGFRRVALPPRAAVKNLRRLRVRGGALTGLAGVASLPGLTIDLEDANPITDWDSLTPPPDGRIILSGRSPADADFRASHGTEHGWLYGERADR